VSEMTRFGMGPADFAELARLLADVVIRKKDVAGDVAAFRGKFSRMRYCLDAEATMRTAPAVFASVFPDSTYFQSFAEALRRV